MLVEAVAEVDAEEFTSGEWIVKPTENPLTDEFNFLMLNIYDYSNSLIVRYTDNVFEIYISTKYLDTDSDDYYQPVIYRFDKNEVVEDDWVVAASESALFFQENNIDTKKEFIKKLMTHEEFVIGYWSHNQIRKTIVYDLTGFTAGISPYLSKMGLEELQ